MLKTLICCILSSLLFSQPLVAGNTKSIVILRGNGYYPPNEMMDADKQLNGVHIDIVRAVAKVLNISIEIKSLPWNRALHLMKKGEADAITHIGKTPEREKFVIFDEGNILSVTRNGFFILKQNSADFNYTGELQQLTGTTIGTINGYSYGNDFDSADYLSKETGTDSEEVLLSQLIRGRFPIAISKIDRIYFIANRRNLRNKITFLKPYMPGVEQYIAFSKVRHHQQLAREFAAALSTFKTTPEYRQILTKYGLEVMDDN
ncbi:MAG: transporter substrate-binding domain-containing protein [Pseudomonadales bacterium]|nr:transporter substrate-binding domain-containing protein [Pseudomonadales bacterium]NRA14058.1 transporter substrate-binding domain-containing protein [Oceanospirillaceae bacterium]